MLNLIIISIFNIFMNEYFFFYKKNQNKDSHLKNCKIKKIVNHPYQFLQRKNNILCKTFFFKLKAVKLYATFWYAYDIISEYINKKI